MNVLAIAIAVIELVSPAPDATVQLVPDNQKTVMSLPTLEERLELFKKDKENGKKIRHGLWRKALPFVVSWKATDDEKGAWDVLVAKKRDFSDARAFDGAKKKDGLVKLEIKYANLEIATTYYWKVICRGKKSDTESEVRSFRTEDVAPRWIAIEGRVGNFRDLGGRIGLGGQRVRQGMIYRSQGLNDNSANGGRRPGRNRLCVADVDYLTGELGIKTELDLRNDGETAKMSVSPLGEKVKYVNRSSSSYAGIFGSSGKKTMAENFRLFLDEKNYPIIFHCIAGADRTGALAYVLNGVLGVSRQGLETDWESTFYPSIPYKTHEKEKRDAKGNLEWDSPKDGLVWNSELHFAKGFGGYGDEKTSWNDRVVLYLKDCGITDEEIAKFRSIMLEKKGQL